MNIAYRRDTDGFAPRVTRAMLRIAALGIALAAVRAVLVTVGVLPHRALTDGAHQTPDLVLWLVCGALVIEIVRALWMSRGLRHTRVERTLPGADAESMAARLMDVGYALDETSESLHLRPPARGPVANLFFCEIARYPHIVELTPVDGGVRAIVRFEILIYDTGESEFAGRLIDYAASERRSLELPRTLHALGATETVVLAAAASVATLLPNGTFAALTLSSAVALFALAHWPILHFQRRRVYGRRFVYLAIGLAAANVLSLLV